MDIVEEQGMDLKNSLGDDQFEAKQRVNNHVTCDSQNLIMESNSEVGVVQVNQPLQQSHLLDPSTFVFPEQTTTVTIEFCDRVRPLI
jgi:hypothetical protein